LGYNFNSSEWYKKSYLLVSTNQTALPKKDKSLLDSFKKILN
ncbi:MAG: outer membrane protein assembly factor BamD, partial [Candidatus Fonsibacter lacus]|nr:outer membrane protein assembly factor BamD [Candidatus Fonsibacter lacus]